MTFEQPESRYTAGDLLREAAARIGLSTDEMTELLESELEIDHLLNYIDAVVSQRMN